jgi:predicted MFS family arabinose efflux permease
VSGLRNAVAVLLQRNYAISSAGYVPALIGLWAQRVGVGWLAWDLTHSPTWLGLLSAADLLPAIALSPIAGAVVDRVHPLGMTKGSQLAMVLHSVALWGLTLSGIIDIYSLFALAVLLGLNNPFTTSARMNMLPLLVDLKDIPTGVALNSTAFNLARIVGPTVAGTLIAASGVDIVFLLNALAQFGFVVSVYFLRLPPPLPGTGRGSAGIRGLVSDLHESIVYTVRHPGIAPFLILLVLTAVTSRPVVDMLPGFADQVFHRGATGLGWLGSALGIGGIAAAVWLASRAAVIGLTRIVVLHAMIVALALIGFAVVPNFWLALAFLAVAGFSMVVSGAGTQTLLQSSVENAMRGRVMALFALLYRGVPALGSLMMGACAEIIGLKPTVAIAAVLCLGSWWWARRREKPMSESLETVPGDG